jgi:hypothetical protein
MNSPYLAALWTLLTTGYGVPLLLAVSLVIWQVRTTFVRLRLIRDLDNLSTQQPPQPTHRHE